MDSLLPESRARLAGLWRAPAFLVMFAVVLVSGASSAVAAAAVKAGTVYSRGDIGVSFERRGGAWHDRYWARDAPRQVAAGAGVARRSAAGDTAAARRGGVRRTAQRALHRAARAAVRPRLRAGTPHLPHGARRRHPPFPKDHRGPGRPHFCFPRDALRRARRAVRVLPCQPCLRTRRQARLRHRHARPHLRAGAAPSPRRGDRRPCVPRPRRGGAEGGDRRRAGAAPRHARREPHPAHDPRPRRAQRRGGRDTSLLRLLRPSCEGPCLLRAPSRRDAPHAAGDAPRLRPDAHRQGGTAGPWRGFP